MKKAELLEAAYNKGFEKEATFHGCSSCSFWAIEEVLGPSQAAEAVYKAATGLAGGVGASTEGHCGALTGASLAIGLRFGRDFSGQEDAEAYAARLDKALDLSRRLQERFAAKYGTVICKEIHRKLYGRTFNLQDPKEFEEFKAAGAFTTGCPSVVGTGARLAVEIILEEEAKASG